LLDEHTTCLQVTKKVPNLVDVIKDLQNHNKFKILSGEQLD